MKTMIDDKELRRIIKDLRKDADDLNCYVGYIGDDIAETEAWATADAYIDIANLLEQYVEK